MIVKAYKSGYKAKAGLITINWLSKGLDKL